MTEYIPAKRIVTKNRDTGWFGNDYQMDIYQGCSHGCIYCESSVTRPCRGAELDRVRVRQDALRLIRDELRASRPGVVGTGAMSDPYNPLERELLQTRRSLELLDAFGFGAVITTKSDLLARDIDILSAIREHAPVLCAVTVTTADDALAARIEPGAPCPSKRFLLLEKLAASGIPAGILMMPVLPFLEDNEINILSVVQAAHRAGAKFIYPGFGVTLRGNQRTRYFDRLNEKFPGDNYAEKYIKIYGNSYRCTSGHVKRLRRVFTDACRQYKILYQMKDIIHYYKRGYEAVQLSLFDL